MATINPEFTDFSRFTDISPTGSMLYAQGSYVRELTIGQVFVDGWFAGEVGEETISIDESPQEALDELNHSVEDILAWVALSLRARIKIGHSPRLMKFNKDIGQSKLEDIDDKGVETLYGQSLPCAPTQYLVDRIPGSVAFMTKDRILEEGSLRPHMREWLEALNDSCPKYNPDMVELATLL